MFFEQKIKLIKIYILMNFVVLQCGLKLIITCGANKMVVLVRNLHAMFCNQRNRKTYCLPGIPNGSALPIWDAWQKVMSSDFAHCNIWHVDFLLKDICLDICMIS